MWVMGILLNSPGPACKTGKSSTVSTALRPFSPWPFLGLVFLIPDLLLPSINLQDGAFHVTYRDLGLPGRHSLRIERTYNSRSPYSGWFGPGWGTDYETYLEIHGDGTISKHPGGVGNELRFVPGRSEGMNHLIETILKLETENGIDEETKLALEKRLNSDQDYRSRMIRKYGLQRHIDASSELILVGHAKREELSVQKDGFRTKSTDGQIQYFDLDGRILRSVKGDYEWRISYRNKRPYLIEDSEGKQLRLVWNEDGLLVRIQGGSYGAHYRYNRGLLVSSRDASGNAYSYSYDAERRLQSIIYSDGSNQSIRYSETGAVIQSKTRDGLIKVYEYHKHPSRPETHFWTDVYLLKRGNREPAGRFEYFPGKGPNGGSFLRRMLITREGRTRETLYSGRCGLPVQIIEGARIISYKYDRFCNLLQKTDSKKGTVTEWSYDIYREGSEARILMVSEIGPEFSTWTRFRYDEVGRLIFAKKKNGDVAHILYDNNSRIREIQLRSLGVSKILRLKYGNLGRPIVIELDGTGTMTVEYDSAGRVMSVESPGGHSVALQINLVFQEFVEVLKSSGQRLDG